MSTLKSIAAAAAKLSIEHGSLAIWIALIFAITGFIESTPWCDERLVGGAFVVAVAAAVLLHVRGKARSRSDFPRK